MNGGYSVPECRYPNKNSIWLLLFLKVITYISFILSLNIIQEEFFWIFINLPETQEFFHKLSSAFLKNENNLTNFLCTSDLLTVSPSLTPPAPRFRSPTQRNEFIIQYEQNLIDQGLTLTQPSTFSTTRLSHVTLLNLEEYIPPEQVHATPIIQQNTNDIIPSSLFKHCATTDSTSNTELVCLLHPYFYPFILTSLSFSFQSGASPELST